MSEKQINDPLQEMWQEQITHSVDIAEIAKEAKTQRRKQRLYVALDILSLTPCAMFFFIEGEFSFAFYVFIACIFVSGLAMVAYFLKLRWLAAFGDITDTHDFTSTLIQQYKNNALIARINKHVGWLSGVASVTVALVLLVMQGETLDESLKKLGIVTMLMIGFCIPWCIWAHRRQKRFESQVANLQSMMG